MAMSTRTIAVAVAVLAVAVLAGAARADWNPPMPAKWVQWPDLSETGIDVRVDQNAGLRRIADDFPCVETGRVTDVHIWGSWLGDYNTGINAFNLRFWSNNPGDPKGGFSQPETLLWEGWITPVGSTQPGAQGHFTERPWATVPYEHFWDPVTNQWGVDHQVVQYNMYIDPAVAFVQRGTKDNPQIYWLEVQAYTSATFDQFGWKTRKPEDGHFMDDAVYWVEPVGTIGYWLPLEYPNGESIDMAFVITPEPATLCLLGAGLAALVARRIRRK
jgi:hypothetical protein